jgi:anti-anti-sigma regulatory factor
MAVQLLNNASEWTLSLSGIVDVAEAGALHTLACEAAAAGPAVIVARLHGLETLDTSATQVLLALRQIRGGRLSVEGTPASVAALWQQAGLHQHLA